MTSILPSAPQPAPLVACTISRDVQEFDLLIEDMEAVLYQGLRSLTHFRPISGSD